DRWGPLFEALAENVATAPPVRPKPLTQDGLLGLFDADQTGAAYVLTPATQAEMRGGVFAEARTLEVVYDTV
ncbi:MAG TPA: chlorophyllide reductase iron protein subunit X, partial [Caulobacteraceae bacterium]|nr:chlorophyllide reductase iron protein subunit X [Caulobacteraceae bacterium]